MWSLTKGEMTPFEKVLSFIILGIPAPVVLMLVFWWGSIPFWQDDRRIMIHALVGLVLGFAADATVLRRYLKTLFVMPFGALISLFSLYSILVYGFFMGFPAFNIFVGIFGAYLVTRNSIASGLGEDVVKSRVNRFLLISTVVLLVLCICTAWLALREPGIADQLEGMLGLGFNVSGQMVWLLIVFGGAGLLLVQYLFARFAANTVIRKFRGHREPQ